MELTEEQIKFLDKVCKGRLNWTLNSEGKVDVAGNVDISQRGLTEIPVKFGKVDSHFNCNSNNLTTLKNCPDYVGGMFQCSDNNLTSLDFYPNKLNSNFWLFHLEHNNLTDYFKNIKEEDFTHWEKLYWGDILDEYPFLVNILKNYVDRDKLKTFLNHFPLTKLYYKD